MKPIRMLILLLALALLVGAAPPARSVEPLNTLNGTDATERPAFDFAQDRPLSDSIHRRRRKRRIRRAHWRRHVVGWVWTGW